MSDFREDKGNPKNRGQRPPGARGGNPRGRGATYAGSDSPGGSGQSGGSGSGQSGGSRSGRPQPGGSQPPYNVYRSAPRSLTARLRGETDADLEARADQLSRQRPPRLPRDGGMPGGRGGGPRVPPPRRGWRRIPGFGPSIRPLWHPLRMLRYFVTFCVFWVALSIVLFFVSASTHSGDLPGGSATEAALSSAGPMLFTPNNILVVGLDNRPTSGYSSKEGGLSSSDHSEISARTDTIMIWRVGGGASRRLSIPRDTLVDIPNCGYAKINAAWVCDGPKGTIQAVEKLTGVKINHMIVVDLGNMVKFIDDIGGLTVATPRICSNISGGAKNGGYTLDLAPGTHHLTGVQAVTLARTRDMPCDPAYTDINRERMQQKILNGIKSQLFSVPAFIHLPWASWDAPGAIQTDMGGLTLMQLFASAEIGGSAPPMTLKEAGGYYNGADVLRPSSADVQSKVYKLMNG